MLSGLLLRYVGCTASTSEFKCKQLCGANTRSRIVVNDLTEARIV